MADALAGLLARRKTLPCKYFYDQRGSRLFDDICETAEYYPTRCEREILWDQRHEVAFYAGKGAALVDLGGCNPEKARILLESLTAPRAYVPVDVSAEALERGAEAVGWDYPDVVVQPLIADFTRLERLPACAAEAARTLFFFAGSTIGNFTPDEAEGLLARLAGLAPRVALLVGVDLKKSRAILDAAYNDAGGLTANFNLNLLRRLNDELDADFDLHSFLHRAYYNEAKGRVEMHLVSLVPQVVHVAGHEVAFAAGETIHTENSHKYALSDFQALARRAGLRPTACWTDRRGLFSLHYLEPGGDE